MTRQRGIQLATQALQAAMADDSKRATEAIKAINAELGGEGLTLAIFGWCDTLDARYRAVKGIADDAPVRFAWQEEGTGDISMTGNDVPAEARWAGQVIAARVSLDKGAHDKLLSSLPDDGWAIGGYISALLSTVALTLRKLSAVTP